MTILYEAATRPCEHILSEETPYSLDEGTVTVVGTVPYPSGTVLGKVAATGKWVKYSNTLANDAGGQATAVLRTPLPGEAGDHKAVLNTRKTEFFGAMLNGGAGLDAAGKADLLAAGMPVR